MTPAQMAEAAMKRLRESINRSAAQHLFHVRKAFAAAAPAHTSPISS